MSVDVSTYRTRIGCFSNTSKQRFHHLPPERLNLSCFGSLWIFKLFAVATVVLVLPSTSGDVESNPGPLTGTEKLDKLQHAIEALTRSSARYQQESSQKLDAINTLIAGLGLRVTSLEAKINEITTVKENVAQLAQELSDVQRESAGVYRHLNVLTETLDDMNNRLRRNNLILKRPARGWTRILEWHRTVSFQFHKGKYHPESWRHWKSPSTWSKEDWVDPAGYCQVLKF